MVAALIGQDTQQVKGIGVGGVRLENLPIKRLRLSKSSVLMRLQCLLEQRHGPVIEDGLIEPIEVARREPTVATADVDDAATFGG